MGRRTPARTRSTELEGGPVPDDKTVYLAGEIRTGVLAHETVHILHQSKC